MVHCFYRISLFFSDLFKNFVTLKISCIASHNIKKFTTLVSNFSGIFCTFLQRDQRFYPIACCLFLFFFIYFFLIPKLEMATKNSLRQTARALGIIFCPALSLAIFGNKYLLSNETPKPNIFLPQKSSFYDDVCH